VSTGRISNLYRVSLLCGDSVESRAWRGKSLRKVPVALCITECKCFVKRSLESSNIVRVVKSRRMRWAGHVARMGEDRGVHRVFVRKPEGKRPLGRPRRRWEDNIKMDL